MLVFILPAIIPTFIYFYFTYIIFKELQVHYTNGYYWDEALHI
jgi:hypothetical protein